MSSRSKHHRSPSPRRDRRWPPHRSSRVPYRYSRDGASLSSDDMGSRHSGHQPPRNRHPSHSSGSATDTHKLAGNSMPHDRARTPRDSSSSCSSRSTDRSQRGLSTGSGNYASREPPPHSKRKLSHGRTDPPGCSMAGVHRALGKWPQERRHLDVASASPSKRAKMEQHSVSAALTANSCAIPQAVEIPHALKRDWTCSLADLSVATASHSEVHLSRELNEESGQGDAKIAPSCEYTSFLSETLYQWKNVRGEKVLCATAALEELRCAFTEKLLAHRNIPTRFSFLGQSNAPTQLSDVVDSTGSHERQGSPEKELHVAVGLQDGDSDGTGKETPRGVLLASCSEPLTLTEEEVADNEAGLESQDISLTGGASHHGEVVADQSQDTSFSVKPAVHDGLSCNLPSTICKGQTDTPGSRRRQYAFGRSSTADVCSDYRQYRVEISPQVNFKSSRPTALRMADGREYHFEGFSVASSVPLDQVPVCYFQRYGCDYSLRLRAEPLLQRFTVSDVLLLEEYLFVSLLELYDWAQSLKTLNTELLFLPRFVSSLEGNTCKVLPLCDVLDCLLQAYQPLIQPRDWACDQKTDMARETYGLLVTHPGKSPACIRVDRLEYGEDVQRIIHFSSPSSGRKLADDGEQMMYQELYKKKQSTGKLERRENFQLKELKLNVARKQSSDHRELLLELPAEGFYSTGIYTDVVQHVLVLPILAHQILFHDSLHFLEEKLQYHFKNRQLLLCALTHSSFTTTSGTTESHVKNTASNCGLRRPEPAISSSTTSQRGLARLVSSVERLEAGGVTDGENRIRNNEQLEFLGDAVLEFLCSLHLYHLFPAYTDGKLTDYRQALVKNKTLTTLAMKLGLAGHMLVGGEEGRMTPPLLHTHAATDCFEAVLGAVCLDGGLPQVQKMFARLVFPEQDLYSVWMSYSADQLKQQCPDGDRHMIEQSEPLQRLTSLEQSVGVQFTHIRLLARAFTHASLGYTNLTMGSYQRMEFLGDAVLQFLASLHVYSHFPNHREGHLSVLRTALVHNKQLAELSRQLGFDSYIITNKTEQVQLSDKVLADVVESFLAALLLDKGLQFAQKFLEVCLFPKLANIIKSSQLVDANTRLHQAVAHRCREEGSKFEMPLYRVLKVEGPSGKQQFTIGVYFRGRRLGVGTGPNTREARAKASEVALQSGLQTRM